MKDISVVIIVKNGIRNIEDCLDNLSQISSDIIVVDSGSTDGTIEMAEKMGAKVIPITWNGYGNARNTGAANCAFDWVLSVDVDERLTRQLINSVKRAEMHDPVIIYGFKRQSYFLDKKIRFGTWAFDKVYRLYNRNYISWDCSPVHESLSGINMKKKVIPGYIDHYTIKQLTENNWKVYQYASLNARKYLIANKKASFIKMYVSPVFNFIQSYLFYLGFLDGKEGFIIARSIAKYTYLKYFYLNEMRRAHWQSVRFLESEKA
jgi:glycosyltransferase involved in cell wall biosynthesis